MRAPVEWGVAMRCRAGEAVSGDLPVVVTLPAGTLVAGIDGLGHGSEAARAARTAGDVVRRSAGADLVAMVERCHAALRGTRGAAISLAFLSSSDGGMTWLGVGNVEGRVLSGEAATTRPKSSLALARGLPGHELPPVRPARIAVRPGDVLVLATDGIDAAFGDSLELSGTSQEISDRILARHWKPPDDGLVIVVRYLGARP